MKTISVLVVSAVVLCVSSFAADQPKSKKEKAQAAPAAEAAKPAAGATGTDAKTYVIGAEDVLLIQVWHEQELTKSYVVRPDGKITMPLAGELQAANLTPEKLAASVVEALSKDIVHPEVTVSIQQVNSKKYFMMGEVARTGSFPLVVPTTVMQALMNAGGFRDFAKKNKIVIIRGANRYYFNYNDVSKGKHREQDIQLEPGDQIIVP
jgi:polysaccharide export outer membrane protein